MADGTQIVEFVREGAIDVGRGVDDIEHVVFARGSVHELPAEQAAGFIGSGKARPTRKKPSAK